MVVLLLVACVGLVLTLLMLPVLIVIVARRTSQVVKQANEELYRDFGETLRKYRIESYEVVVEKTVLACDAPPSGHVRRIFFDNKGQYYLYLFYSGNPGFLKPLSRERALLAAGTSGEFKV